MTSGRPDAVLARRLAGEAGELLLELRRGPLRGESLALAGDAASHGLLLRRLHECRPGDVVLSEEAADPHGRAGAARVWIVDPLDGSREFGEPGRRDWAVHVALHEGGALTDGAVALPATGMTYATDEPPVIAPQRREPSGPLRIAVSRTRPPALAQALAAELGAVLVPLGSAGAKCASVWTGDTDAYVHTGGQFEWDSAAPVAVARACGLFASRVDGSPLRYNQPDLWLPDLLVCRPELAEVILAVTARGPDVTSGSSDSSEVNAL